MRLGCFSYFPKPPSSVRAVRGFSIVNLTILAFSSKFCGTSFPIYSLRQRHSYGKQIKQEKRPRMNEQITVPEVLLVGEGGEAEKLTIAEALARAKEAETDLIEVSPKATPPVVKLGDFGHFLYQLQKKEKKQKAHSKQSETKMLRFGFRTEKHDLDRLVERAREFLAERHMVKFAVRLRGRELTNKDYAIQKLKGLMLALKDVAEVEQDVKAAGNQFIAVVRPSGKSPSAPEAK
jgi:translation initiation factor IF-3